MIDKFTFRNIKIYIALLLFFIILFFFRISDILLPNIIDIHINNFAITGGLFLLSSDSLVRRLPFTKKRLLLEMLPFAALNIIIELFIKVDTIKIDVVEFTNFNTPDPIDMVYGIGALVLIYFVIIRYSEKISVQNKP